MQLHLYLHKAIQTDVHCSCTYTSRKQIQTVVHCNCTDNSRKQIQTAVHCSCTYTTRKQIQSYYIKIQTTSNVHYTIIIWDIKIQNLTMLHKVSLRPRPRPCPQHEFDLTRIFSLWSVRRYGVLSLAFRRGSSQVAKGGISSN